jgi:chromosome segregation ATPase
MADTSSVEEAMKRLAAALDRLEGAVHRRLDNERQVRGLENDLHRLGTDRSRLAQSLDAAEARSARLEDANREVSRRLVAAMESIREVLDRHAGIG